MLPNLVLFFLIFLLPFIVISQFPLAFETPKVIIAEVLIELLIISAVLRRHRPAFAKRKRFLILLLVVLFLSTLAGVGFKIGQVQIFGNVFRLQGVILFWHLLVLAFLAPKIVISEKFRFTPLILLGGLLITTLMMGENKAGRAVGTLGEPNALAATAVVFLPFAFLSLKGWIFKLSSLVVSLIIILLSQSVSGLLAWVLVGLVLLTVNLGKWNLAFVSRLVLILVCLSLFLPFLDLNKTSQTPSAVSPYRFEIRSEIWETAFMAGMEKPIFGWGFGNVTSAINETSKKLSNDLHFQFIDSSHNFLLDFWIQGGIIGFIAIVLLIHFSLTNLVKDKKLLETALLIGVITVMFFNPMSIGVLIAFWYSIGQGFTPNRPES